MKGSVKVNGTERNLSAFRKSSCYILQSDQLHPHFTVLETMYMAASLKLGPGVGKKARQIEVRGNKILTPRLRAIFCNVRV
jgi:ATP-binding cassette, subfamily G (WHITE), member 1